MLHELCDQETFGKAGKHRHLLAVCPTSFRLKQLFSFLTVTSLYNIPIEKKIRTSKSYVIFKRELTVSVCFDKGIASSNLHFICIMDQKIAVF